jgi:hypothetical protein
LNEVSPELVDIYGVHTHKRPRYDEHLPTAHHEHYTLMSITIGIDEQVGSDCKFRIFHTVNALRSLET